MHLIQRTILTCFMLCTMAFAGIPSVTGASGDWYSLTLEATPQGALAGFQWTIPADAFHPDPDYPDGTWMTLEFAALKQDDTEWAVLAFAINGSAATSAGSHIATHQTHEVRITPALVATEQQTASGDGTYLRFEGIDWLGDTVYSPGDTLGFVLAARGAGPTEIFFRVLDHAPAWHEQSDSDAGELHAELSASGPATTPSVVGTGNGFHHAYYDEFTWGVVSAPFVWGASAPGILGVKTSTQDVQVRENLPTDLHPAGPARDLTLASDFYAESGWARTRAAYMSEQGNGKWSFDSRGRAAFQDEGIYTSAAFPYGTLLLGAPSIYLEGDGQGISGADFDLLVADTQSLTVIAFERLELGAPLADLIGASTGDVTQTWISLTEWAAQVATELAEAYGNWGTDLVLDTV